MTTKEAWELFHKDCFWNRTLVDNDDACTRSETVFPPCSPDLCPILRDAREREAAERKR